MCCLHASHAAHVIALATLVTWTTACGDDAASAPDGSPGSNGDGDGGGDGDGDGSGGDGDGDGLPEPPAIVSDEFDLDADVLRDGATGWSILHPERASRVEIGGGALTVVGAAPDDGANWGWFQDDYGVLVHREVTGNFAAMVRLAVVDDLEPTEPPTGSFNAGGFVIRDAAGTHSGDENWVMYNMGSQGPTGYSREIKKTSSSQSGLYLNPQTFESTALLVCRIGSAFHFLHWDAEAAAWVPERFEPDVTQNSAHSWPEVDTSGESPMVFEHPGMPATLQLGLMAHSYNAADPDDTSGTRATFEYLRMAGTPPETAEQCSDGFSAP